MEEAEIPEPDPLYNGAWYMMEVVIQTRKRDMGELGRMAGRGEVAQTMHTHVSKCKNDKIKGEKKSLPIIAILLSYKTLEVISNIQYLHPLTILSPFLPFPHPSQVLVVSTLFSTSLSSTFLSPIYKLAIPLIS
jgi:hypothetical protein